VQQRLIDLHIEIEEARALTADNAALRAADADHTAAQRRQLAATRACVVQAARHVWKESVQLHGAIGMTNEYKLGHYVKRLAPACTLLGPLEDHLEALVALALDGH